MWQVDMKLPKRNLGRKGVDGSAPIRDRTSLWPKGVIPYTIAYSIRKLSQFLNDFFSFGKVADDSILISLILLFFFQPETAKFVNFYQMPWQNGKNIRVSNS